MGFAAIPMTLSVRDRTRRSRVSKRLRNLDYVGACAVVHGYLPEVRRKRFVEHELLTAFERECPEACRPPHSYDGERLHQWLQQRAGHLLAGEKADDLPDSKS